jgi:hypothetical protein
MANAREQNARPTLADLQGAPAPDGRVRRCPACRRRLFYVVRTWTLRDGTIRRLRKCAACGHPASSSERFD